LSYARRVRSFWLQLVLVCAAAIAASATALGADHTYTVNTTADGADANPGDGICATSGGACTLRAAVMESNHTVSGTVEIRVPANAQAYVLSIPPTTEFTETSGALRINRDVSILGGGAAHTIIDGNGTDRVLEMDAFAGYTEVGGAGLVLSDLTMRNGSTTSDRGGGGIYTDISTLTVRRCVIASNSAAHGGGIAAHFSNLLTLDHSTVSGNMATAGPGGGIDSSIVSIGVSTISGNTASTEGGGLYLAPNGSAGSSSILYSTIAGNTAGSSGFSGQGGGIFNSSTTITVTGSTLSGNSIVTNPFPTIASSDCAGTFGGGTNLVFTKSGCTITAAVGNPLLGPLQLNGGQLPTRALGTGSPAIDAGNPTSCAFNDPGDERGAHRPAGAACDLGAYERDANGDEDGDGARTVADVFYLINFLFAGGVAPNGLGDVNGDTKTDVADVFYLINFLFAGGPAPL
jgi:CSLREA domain-containing protein